MHFDPICPLGQRVRAAGTSDSLSTTKASRFEATVLFWRASETSVSQFEVAKGESTTVACLRSKHFEG